MEEDMRAKKAMLGQIPPPLEKVKKGIAQIELLMGQGDKVVKHNPQEWVAGRAIAMTFHTLLGERDTWMLLLYLTILCFTTMIVVYVSGSSRSSRLLYIHF